MIKLGVDLGGTKIEVAAIDQAGRFLWRERLSTPSGDYRAIIDTIKQLLDEVTNALNLEGRLPVGIATPGSITKSGVMKNCNSVVLNGKPLLGDLKDYLQRPVRIMNDANCFALSESASGVASNYGDTFGVIIGTGVGGGLIINNAVLSGVNGIGGEWGHNLMPGLGEHFVDEQHHCYCGRINCIETYLSGSGLSAIHHRLHAKWLSAKDISQSALRGDTQSQGVLDEYSEKLAMALSQVINIVDPACVVLGGGLSNIDYLYQSVPQLWEKFIFSDQVNTCLLKAEHGDSSGIRRAAWLWD